MTPSIAQSTLILRNPLPPVITKCSARELGKRLRLSPSTARRQLSGQSALTLDTIGRMCSAFGLAVTDVVVYVPIPAHAGTHTTTKFSHLTTEEPESAPLLPHEVNPHQPWLVARTDPAAYPFVPDKDRPNLPAHATPEDKTLFERSEFQSDWANYRHYATKRDYMRAAVAVSDYLRKPHTITDLQAHLQTHGAHPTNPIDSIAHMVRIPKRLNPTT